MVFLKLLNCWKLLWKDYVSIACISFMIVGKLLGKQCSACGKKHRFRSWQSTRCLWTGFSTVFQQDKLRNVDKFNLHVPSSGKAFGEARRLLFRTASLSPLVCIVPSRTIRHSHSPPSEQGSGRILFCRPLQSHRRRPCILSSFVGERDWKEQL